jgi:hypothetical protein
MSEQLDRSHVHNIPLQRRVVVTGRELQQDKPPERIATYSLPITIKAVEQDAQQIVTDLDKLVRFCKKTFIRLTRHLPVRLRKYFADALSFVKLVRLTVRRATKYLVSMLPQPLRTTGRYMQKHYLEYPLLAVILLSALAPALSSPLERLQSDRYKLDKASSLLTSTPTSLKKNISYDAKNAAYTFTPPADEQGPPNSANSQSAGGVKYSATLNSDAKKGITLTDTANKLGISLTPNFDTQTAKKIDNHIVYPVSGSDAQLVYTFMGNGLKEDIVLYSSDTSEASFSYSLKLPSALKAMLQQDGSIGIYGGDSSLYGNISYGSDKDKALVDKARANSAKNTLLYVIPAPTVKGDTGGKVKASFSLKDNQLTVHAINLTGAYYPLTIDPSLALASSGDFVQGNDEGNIDLSVAGQISRGGLTGGSTSSWATGTAATQGIAFVYNGYRYSVNAGYAVYSPIGSDGAGFINATQISTNYPSTSGQIYDFAEYNGYAYAIGGVNSTATNPPCGGFLQPTCTYTYTSVNIASYSKIQPDGSFGVWQTTSNLASVHYTGGLAAYNGYVYAFNGYTPGGTNLGTQYAKINPDGSLGTWQSSTTLVPGNGLSSANSYSIYNGYFYVTGGQSGSGALSSTFFAPLSSSGFGAWQASTSLFQSTFNATATAYRGYLYVAGGCTGASNAICSNNSSVLSTVQYAPIYANGQLGPWSINASLSGASGREGGAIVGYNSYLYVSGGYFCNGASGDCANATLSYYNDFQYAKLDAAGKISTPTTIALPAARGDAASVAWNGYLYIAGGCVTGACSSTNVVSSIIYAPITTTGLGSWATTSTALPALGTNTAGRKNFQMAVVGGKLILIGGTCYSAVGGVINTTADVATVSIDLTGNITGSWSTSASLGTARESFGAASVNGYIYVYAGNNTAGVAQSSTEYASVSALGAVGTWATTSAYPTALIGVAGTANPNGYIYGFAGGTTGGGTSVTAYYAKPASDGTIPASGAGSWTATTSIPNPTSYSSAYFDKGFIYLAGGTAGNNGSIVSVQVNADGSIPNSWASNQGLTSIRDSPTTVIAQGNIYVCGGYSSSAPVGDCSFGVVNNGGSGSPSSWTNPQGLPTGRTFGSATAANGYLYYLASCTNADCGPGPGSEQTTVYYTKILSDGSLTNPWTSATNAMPLARGQSSVAVVGNYIYAIGGWNTSQGPTNSVMYSLLDASTGAPGTWTNSSSYNTLTNTRGSSAVAYNGYIYLAEGDGGGALTYATEYTYVGPNGGAPTNPGCGTVWCATTSLPSGSGTLFGATVVNKGKIYFTGGLLTSGSTNSNDTYYADLSPSGIGSWTKANTKFYDGRFEHYAAAANGYLYVVGGASNSGGCSASTQYAPFLNNGDLGAWQAGPSLSQGRNGVAGTYAGGALYTVAGQPCGTPVATVDKSVLQSISPKARYSKLFTTDKDVTPVNMFQNSAGNSSLSISYQQATQASPIFGSSQATIFTPNSPTTLATTQGSYFLFNFVLDDTQNSSFPDSVGSSTTLSYFKFNYHPNSTQRLRGGKTFNSGAQQSLDAP